LAITSRRKILNVAIGTRHGDEYLLHMIVSPEDFKGCPPMLQDTFEAFRVVWIPSSHPQPFEESDSIVEGSWVSEDDLTIPSIFTHKNQRGEQAAHGDAEPSSCLNRELTPTRHCSDVQSGIERMKEAPTYLRDFERVVAVLGSQSSPCLCTLLVMQNRFKP
jgi:hypothetical protein